MCYCCTCLSCVWVCLILCCRSVWSKSIASFCCVLDCNYTYAQNSVIVLYRYYKLASCRKYVLSYVSIFSNFLIKSVCYTVTVICKCKVQFRTSVCTRNISALVYRIYIFSSLCISRCVRCSKLYLHSSHCTRAGLYFSRVYTKAELFCSYRSTKSAHFFPDCRCTYCSLCTCLVRFPASAYKAALVVTELACYCYCSVFLSRICACAAVPYYRLTAYSLYLRTFHIIRDASCYYCFFCSLACLYLYYVVSAYTLVKRCLAAVYYITEAVCCALIYALVQYMACTFE